MTGMLACRIGLAVWCAVAVAWLAPTARARAAPLGSITEVSVPTLAGAINGNRAEIAAGPDGNMWYTADQTIGEISPSTHQTNEVGISDSVPYGIVAGPDGKMWFTDLGTVRAIGEIDPKTHAVTKYPIPITGANVFPNAYAIARGPDGNLWFTESGTLPMIGEINPTTHAITQYPILDGGGPGGITAGSDGNMWFTLAGSIAAINPSTHEITQFPVAGATDIAQGPGGELWFTRGASVGEINVFTHAVHEFPTPTIPGVGGGPELQKITEGPDGNMWFTVTWNWYPAGGNPQAVGEISPTTHRIREFRVPHANLEFGNYPEDVPFGIAAGPDGRVWFADAGNAPSIGIVGPERDRAVISDLIARPNGTVNLRLVAGSTGRVDVLETAWSDNLAPSPTARTSAAATQLEPASRRFVVARSSTTVVSGDKVSLTVAPNRLGRELLRRHRYRVTLRVWVAYTPTDGRTRTIGLYGLHLAGKCPAVTNTRGRIKAACV